MDIDTMITTYNTALTDAASEILGKELRRKKLWISKDILDLRDNRRDFRGAEGANSYMEAKKRIQNAVKKANEDCIGVQCEDIEICLNRSNSERAYQLVGWLVGCFGLNGPLRQYFSLYQAVSQRVGERKEK